MRCFTLCLLFSFASLLSGQALDQFSLIPGGSFQMGDALDGLSDAPVVTVNVSAFYMGQYEVTKAEWDEVRTWGLSNGYTDLPSGSGKAADHPVHSINWYAMVKWCNARSEQEGRTPCYTVSGSTYREGSIPAVECDWTANGYRLPTEAEWEKAARGGATGQRFPWGDTISHANTNYRESTSYSYDIGDGSGHHPSYNDGSSPYTSPVGSFAANGYGLYDMAGNLYEWCWDWYSSSSYSDGAADPRGASSGSNRVLRCGGWNNDASYCRVAYRDDYDSPDNSSNFSIGFRVALSFDATTDTDGDGLVDSVETNTGIYVSETDTGTDPNNADSDGDGVPDGLELTEGTDPTLASDFNSFSTGLVAYYPFDGYANLAGDSEFTAYNETSLVDGPWGKAFRIVGKSFSAGDGGYGQVNLADDFTATGVSYSFWIFEEEYPGGWHGNHFLDRNWDGLGHLWMWADVPHNGHQPGIMPHAKNGGSNGELIIATNHGIDYQNNIHTAEIIRRGWRHYVVVADPDGTKYFVDGDLKLISELPYSQKGPLRLGYHEYGSGIATRMTARYDNLRVYDKLLTDSEVSALFYSEAPQYQIIEGNFTWHEAKADAEARGGRLAVLNTQEKIDAANLLVSGAYAAGSTNETQLWIGLSDIDDEGNFEWIDGSPLGISNWVQGQPDDSGGNEDVVHMHVSHQLWNDNRAYRPDYTYGYLLEIVQADRDGDGLLDTWEQQYFGNLDQAGSGDPDTDGHTNEAEETAGSDPSNASSTPTDTDADGLPDTWEMTNFGNLAADGSGDADSDGHSDAEEYSAATDPNDATYTPADRDGDGLLDTWEQQYFGNLDQEGPGDPDTDGHTNEAEETAGSDPSNASSTPTDTDADGLPDAWEMTNFGNLAADGSGDADSDGHSDAEEYSAATDPNDATYTPADRDGDGLLDTWEQQYFGNLDQAGDGDFDSDGFTNEEEETAGLDPTSVEVSEDDSDGDGLLDALEIVYFGNLDEVGSGDNDSDGYTNAQELAAETDPTDAYSNPIYKPFTFTLNSTGTAYSVTDFDTTVSGDVVIPSSYRDDLPVTAIGEDAFWQASLVTSITIPNTVTAIGPSAFQDCSSITSMVLPDGITSIRNGQFSGCSSLVEVTIPESVNSIEWYAFEFCTSLESIVIPQGVADIEVATFYKCRSLVNVSIPDSVTTIEYLAFYGCEALESITIPDSVTTLDADTFAGCSSLKGITIPEGIQTIYENTFSGCRSLAYVNLPSSLTTIGASAFLDCSSLTSITIPAAVTAIRENTFEGCSSLASVSLPDDIRSIGIYAFSDCVSLTSIDLPEQLSVIEYGLFYNCTNLERITIPNGVTSIGWLAFDSCASLTEVILPDTVSTIGGYAFNYCTALQTIHFPDSVISIGNFAFDGCTSLNRISFAGDAPTVGSGAFNDIAADAVIHYRHYASGFTSPTWEHVSAEVLLLAPVLSIQPLYEPQLGESITVSAVPVDGYPEVYTYQWYLNNEPIASFGGGKGNNYTFPGDMDTNGTWAVEVTNSTGTTRAEFVYEIFVDDDGDGLSNYREVNITFTDPSNADTDADGLTDAAEILTHGTDATVMDSDADGLSDGDEVNAYETDPLDSDSDNDGLSDYDEVRVHNTDPNAADSDNDTLSDGEEVNQYSTNPNLSDGDADGLTDAAEVLVHGTNPNSTDTDADGLSDAAEVNSHPTDPLIADTNGDGLNDGIVFASGLDFNFDYSALVANAIENNSDENTHTQADVDAAAAQGRSSGINEVLADPSQHGLYTTSQLRDLRIGSTMLAVQNGQANLSLILQESVDLNTWAAETEVTIEIPIAPEETIKFFRFAMPE